MVWSIPRRHFGSSPPLAPSFKRSFKTPNGGFVDYNLGLKGVNLADGGDQGFHVALNHNLRLQGASKGVLRSTSFDPVGRVSSRTLTLTTAPPRPRPSLLATMLC